MTGVGSSRGAAARAPRSGAPRRVAAALAVLLAAGCGSDPASTPGAEHAEARYVGGETCAACHAAEAAAWRGSHHDLAMQVATDATVLGDFANATAEHGGATWTFYRDGDAFRVRAPLPSGDAEELTVTHTFGVEPLQQYLVPRDGGRLQALGFAWDSRPESAGGQRWLHLYPDEAFGPDDPLHWSARAQNWNAGCAYCHSTALETGYDAARDEFATTWSSIDVDCEACHGPGSLHVADPAAAPLALGRAPRRWLRGERATAALEDADPARRDVEIAVCASCHSRRGEITGAFRPGDPLLDHFRPELLTPDLYHADGQILDEVFEHGSFVQSRMYAAGVACSDCHEPHSATLRRDGNALCTGCHSPAQFDAPSHHRHAPGTPGAACVDCHMPAQTYMRIDSRRDHSFRIPRPALAAAVGSTDPCASCHDGGADWAAQRIAEWFPQGRQAEPHYGTALHAGRTWAAERDSLLAALARDGGAPAIARATAVRLIAASADTVAVDAAAALLRDPEPLVVLEALAALDAATHRERVDLAQRFLDHELRALRLEAARVLAPARELLGSARRADLDAALAEYFAAEERQKHGAAGWYNTALVHAALGDPAAAIAELERALERDPLFAPAYVNLAELERLRGRPEQGERVLRDGLERLPEDASLHYALGLALVRGGRLAEATAELAAAAAHAPSEPLYAYAHALAVAEEDSAEAAPLLEAVAARFPGYRPALFALAARHRDAGRIAEARRLAERIVAMAPADRNARALLAELDAR